MPLPSDVLGFRACKRGASLAIFAMALLVSGGGLAQQPPAQKDSAAGTTTLDRKTVPQAVQDENKFKTREQRLRAQPLDWNATIGKREPAPAPAESPAREENGAAAGGAPNPKADDDARRQFPNEWRPTQQPGTRGFLDLPSDGNIQLAGTQDVYTQYCENCPVDISKDKRIGKLFTNAGTCTASVVSPNNAIVTAAHCCYNRSTNNWIGGWSFAPAYNNGSTPYGQFNWSSATILTAWINTGSRPTDVCVIRLQNNSANRPVTYYTGWLGRSWNFSSIQDHHALGYPGNIGGGQRLELCTSESFSPSAACGGATVLNTGCSMTYGASGGPWIRGYRDGGNWVNSVVSGYDSTTCTGTFGQTFNGARFTSSNIVPICNAAGC
jgi:hypothetical protein